TEIFDPLTALAEVDFRFVCSGRVRPIPGHSLRRLLDLGWLTEAEIAAHALPVDYNSLAAHDSRPYYPWRPVFRGPSPEPGENGANPPPYDRRIAAGPAPCDAERRARARQVGPGILAHDRRMAELARDFSRAAREAELLEQMADMFAANAARQKREEAAAAAAAALAASSDPAERRITPEPSRAGPSSQPPLSGTYSPPPHRRTYPASQPHTGSSPFPPRAQAGGARPPPGVGAKGNGKKRLQRVGTQPIDADTDDRPARPAGGRGLARTHTVAQLAV
ncbi:hypothetical protein HYPSUDRAFT_210168, partial [Hypholoma sublateritium FD-334 SS-4]